MMFYGLLGLMAMAAGALVIALMAFPAGFVRDRVVAAVKERTGRDLIIAGPASFTVYPSVGVSLGDVSLSGGPGIEGSRPLVTMRSLDLSVALWPLLQRELRVQKLVLRDPVFNLEVDGSGRRSWDFAAADDPSTWVRVAEADIGAPLSDAESTAPGGGTPAAGSGMRVGALSLDDVRIDNGTLVYRNALTGGAAELSAIDVKLALAALTAPLLAEGSVDWKGRSVRFDGKLSTLADIIISRPAKLNLALGTDALDATFEGSATLEEGLVTEGILSAKSSSARSLAAWFGTELPPSDGFGALTAKGLLRGSPGRLTFANAEIVLDRTTAHGEISLDTQGMRPFVKANLKLTELDLNTYSSKGERTNAPGPRGDGASSIEDLLDRTEPAAPGPRVKGYTKRAGWDDDPFDLEALGLVDADAKLSIGRLTVRTIRLDQSDVSVALKNRVMTTTLDDVRLYGGTGQGTIILDGSDGATARLGADLKLEGIEAEPLLKDASDIDRLTGKGRLVLVLTGAGGNEREVVDTLAGRMEFAFQDGAILGINVAEMVRGLGKGDLGGLATAPSDRTDFSELTSTWTVTAGIAENQDLKLVGPLLRLTGSGRVALPQREVDYILRPRLVASLAGQGSNQQDLAGLEIPVRMHGPLDNPKFTPDLANVDANQAVEAIREIGKQFKGRNAGEVVDEILSGQGETRDSAKAKGKKLLEQFLGPR